MGTLSLLAGIDLLTGEAIPLVSLTHKSSDFIEFLKIVDAKYPKGDTIRLILDNHSAHKSKETKRFLSNASRGKVCICVYANTCIMAEYDREFFQ